MLRLKKVQKRFTAQFVDDTSLDISFGAGTTGTADEIIIPNPYNVGIGLQDGISKFNTAFDPSNFFYTNEYGQAPVNTTLTFTYVVGGGAQSNLPPNDINITNTVNPTIDSYGLESSVVQTVLNSISFNNNIGSTGGGPGDTIEEIRQNALANFPTQLRNVTQADYLVRTLSMPTEFGYIAKAYIAQDLNLNPDTDKANTTSNNPLALSVYILTNNNESKLVNANSAVKQNLKTYLSYNKMMSDAVNIKDAYYINIKVNFDISILPAYNSQDVLSSCINVLKDYFNIVKWQINQPIIYSDVYNLIGAVKGVQSVIKVDLTNLSGGNYSTYSYDLKSATKQGVIYPSLDPMIFEVRFPDDDIYGKIVTY
jgi:hypothetical protein